MKPVAALLCCPKREDPMTVTIDLPPDVEKTVRQQAAKNGQDVGATGLAGSASYSNGTFTVKGAGADIWGTADGFFYASQSISGDAQIEKGRDD